MDRKQFLDSSSRMNEYAATQLHRRYYSQFVTQPLIDRIKKFVSVDEILASGEKESFNDIPIYRWKEIDLTGLGLEEKLERKGHLLILSTFLCVLKEAARQIREEVEGREPDLRLWSYYAYSHGRNKDRNSVAYENAKFIYKMACDGFFLRPCSIMAVGDILLIDGINFSLLSIEDKFKLFHQVFGPKKLTRSEYLDAGRNSSVEDRQRYHRQYYGQFVTKAVIERVKRYIGVSRIMSSKDDSFNSIPLRLWESIDYSGLGLGQKFLMKGDYLSVNGLVCVFKEAAMQIKEGGN